MGSDLRHAVARATEDMRHRAWDAREGLRCLGSIVSRDLGAGLVAARVPARELRHGVTWDRR